MGNSSKQLISAGDNSSNLIAGRDIVIEYGVKIPTDLVDQKIEEEIERLRKSRFFPEYDRTLSSLSLGRRLEEGNLSGGTDKIRSLGLAWSARILSLSNEFEQAEGFLNLAKQLCNCPEVRIAESFILSMRGNKTQALKNLAVIDSLSSRSAGLMIVAHHEGAEGALKWMVEIERTADHLDSDGKSFLLNKQLQLGRWECAAKTVCSLSVVDFASTPILHHLSALTMLIPSVPAELRDVVLIQAPFESRLFPLASDSKSMEERRSALRHFLDAERIATLLNCPVTARTDDEYALWLELRDPEQFIHGKNRLEKKLQSPETALRFVQLALQFDFKLDLDAVEREIERNIALNGATTSDAALARFSLAFTKQTPEEAANYIARYYNQLSAHIDTNFLGFRQVELLARAGLLEKAKNVFERLTKSGISAEQESRLRRLISEAEGEDTIESCKSQFERTKNLGDLINLVAELEVRQRWDDLCQYGRDLFERTRSLSDAEKLARSYTNARRTRVLVEFVESHKELLKQSNDLCMLYAWALYNEGAFVDSKAVFAALRISANSRSYRALTVNLGIAMGDWASLSSYISSEYQNKDERSAQELIHTAQLALNIDSIHARDLVYRAADKAAEDPAVLVAAYFIAISAGWEDDPLVYQWLEKAANLSGDNGPLQKMSLKDIFDRKPEWDRRESDTWRLFAQGLLPTFLVAKSLNRTIIDLSTFSALANLELKDARRKNGIAAFSAKRLPSAFKIHGTTIALDVTALLTLGFLRLLEVTLDAFEVVYIPHSSLGWLFTERQRASFHQPSRIANAHKIRDLLATGKLEKFVPSTAANSDLAAQVGDELSQLITEAEEATEFDNAQRIVVRPAPVHRLSSLMEEEAELSAHERVLSSCTALVEMLKQKGVITATEESRARTYLQLHEKPWPNQPKITDGAILYLDALAISYLSHLKLLGKISAAGLTAVVSPNSGFEVDALIAYEKISVEVKDIIEYTRASLSSRMVSRRIRVGPSNNCDDSTEKSILEHPSAELIALTSFCDVAIIDDRFFNKHQNLESGGKLIPIFTTLDLLDSLVAAGILTNNERLDHRTQLRRAEYFFVSITIEELEKYLIASTVVEGVVCEAAELKAIRESILRARMSDWLQLPEEAPWLDGTIRSIIQVIRNLWRVGVDIEATIARSNWLVELIDIRGWSHCLNPESADYVLREGRAKYILLLLIPIEGIPQNGLDTYWSWIESRILIPIREQFPQVYEWIIDWYRRQIAVITDRPS